MNQTKHQEVEADNQNPYSMHKDAPISLVHLTTVVIRLHSVPFMEPAMITVCSC